MAHIANKIVAKDISLNQVFTDNRYRIDVFQRDYRWQLKHIDALISDLTSSFLANYVEGHTPSSINQYNHYYMGPIVLCEDGNEASIVDGQQRLTSFLLLLIFLSHLQKELNLGEDNYKDLTRYIYVSKSGRKSFALDVPTREIVMKELMLSGNHIMLDNQDGMITLDKESNHNLLLRYEDICQMFPSEIKRVEVLPVFIEWLLFNVVLVEIRAFSMDSAYTIFETMNDRGLNLSPTEILKAFILSKVSDEDKSEELNEIWKDCMSSMKLETNNEDADSTFFRAWLRAKYADSIRQGQANNEQEDFELIGARFHNWFKNNLKKFNIKSQEDYYNFVKGDIKFFSQKYVDIMVAQQHEGDTRNPYFVTANYPMADSLYLPLMLAPVMARDSQLEVEKKLSMVNAFVDIFVNIRTLSGRSVNQSTIRRKVFEIVKRIRNASMGELQSVLLDEVSKMDGVSLSPSSSEYTQNYMHYVLARIKYEHENSSSFSSLLRTRKQSSYILRNVFTLEEWDDMNFGGSGFTYWSIENLCLCRRLDNTYKEPILEKRIKMLYANGCFPEMSIEGNEPIENFLQNRLVNMENEISTMWSKKVIENYSL